ncbi:uncharacterized [Tachysurus ichikawai]
MGKRSSCDFYPSVHSDKVINTDHLTEDNGEGKGTEQVDGDTEQVDGDTEQVDGDTEQVDGDTEQVKGQNVVRDNVQAGGAEGGRADDLHVVSQCTDVSMRDHVQWLDVTETTEGADNEFTVEEITTFLDEAGVEVRDYFSDLDADTKTVCMLAIETWLEPKDTREN